MITVFIIVVMTLYVLVLLVPGLFFSTGKNAAENPVNDIFISVIVPVRNEEKNIALCLETINRLDFPRDRFEIIVADDHSEDDTVKIAETFREKISSLVIVRNEAGKTGKKAAISNGVGLSKGEWILQTDGDCMIEPGWLKAMVQLMSGENIFIAGPVSFYRGKSFLAQTLRVEQLSLQAISGGTINMHQPLMCNGANMAYRRDFFLRCGGFEHDRYASGDDTTLLMKAAKENKRGVKFCFNRKAIVETHTSGNFTEAVMQRRRWISKFSARSSFPVVFSGCIVAAVYFLLLFLAAITVMGFITWKFFAAVLLVKTGVDLLLLSLALPFFRQYRLLFFVPAGEIIYPFIVLAAFAGRLTGKLTWKGR